MTGRSSDGQDVGELLRLLLEQENHYVLILLDPRGKIIAWLAAAEQVFGYTADEVIGRPFTMLFTPEDLAKEMPEHELEVATYDGASEDDRWMMRKDGIRIWASGVVTPLRKEGQIVGFSKMLRNRTDYRGQVEALERTVENLRNGDDRKNRFISTLSHELRNPLASITSTLELLRMTVPKTEDNQFALATLARQADNMRRMVDDLLDVTRIGAGKVQLVREVLPLGDILHAAAAASRPTVDARTHEFQLVIPSTPILVDADSTRLQQVFVNLIENAAKYTQYGGNIWVKLAVDGADAVVKVEDSGVGISPEVLPRIFDMFTQAEFARDHESGGLGIGLSVVKNLVMLHGGSVQVRSDGIGKGSEFTVRLPLAGADGQRPDKPG